MLFVMVLTAIFLPLNSYAMNEELIGNVYLWDDIDTRIDYNDEYFNGFLKYISDSNEGCFYVYLNYTDTRMLSDAEEYVQLNFTIRSNDECYTVCVDRNGLVNQELADRVSVKSDFNIYPSYQGGKLMLCIELKRKADKTVCNYISCSYSCGEDITNDLFEDIELDMSVATTMRQTTAKKTTSAKSTAEKTTKFSASTSATSKESTTKFETSQSTTEPQSEELSDITNSVTADNNTAVTEGTTSSKMTSTAGVLMLSGFVCAAAGFASVLAGLIKGKKVNGKDIED